MIQDLRFGPGSGIPDLGQIRLEGFLLWLLYRHFPYSGFLVQFFFFMMDEAVGRGWWWVGQALPRPTALVPVGLATTFRLWPRPPPVQGGRGVATALSPTPISLHYYVPCG